MSLDSLAFYMKDIATSICEAFHSYLAYWAPKGIDFPVSYETRVLMAELCWMANQDRIRKELPRRKEPETGKRARGRYHSLWKSPINLTWTDDIFSNMITLGIENGDMG